jgi:hypothetical protein
VLVKDIIDGSDSEREEDNAEITEACPSVVGKKIKVWDAMDITLPYLPHAVVTVDDMLGKVPKLRYSYHDVCDAAKFPDLLKRIT